jgi:hypothetical protein
MEALDSIQTRLHGLEASLSAVEGQGNELVARAIEETKASADQRRVEVENKLAEARQTEKQIGDSVEQLQVMFEVIRDLAPESTQLRQRSLTLLGTTVVLLGLSLQALPTIVASQPVAKTLLALALLAFVISLASALRCLYPFPMASYRLLSTWLYRSLGRWFVAQLIAVVIGAGLLFAGSAVAAVQSASAKAPARSTTAVPAPPVRPTP